MIFFDGEIYENDMCDKLLSRFEDRICDTLGNYRLSAKQVMLAAEKISTDIENGAFDDMLSTLDVENVSYYKQLIISCLSRENLRILDDTSAYLRRYCIKPDEQGAETFNRHKRLCSVVLQLCRRYPSSLRKG